jgi:hypothetical protein
MNISEMVPIWIVGVMVDMLALSAVDCGFDLRSNQRLKYSYLLLLH